jgi:hypothetical protein
MSVWITGSEQTKGGCGMKVEIDAADILYYGSVPKTPAFRGERACFIAGIYLGRDEFGKHLVLCCDLDVDPCYSSCIEDVESAEKIQDEEPLCPPMLHIGVARINRTPDLDKQLDAIPIDTPICIEYTGRHCQEGPLFRVACAEKKRAATRVTSALSNLHLKLADIARLRRITDINE